MRPAEVRGWVRWSLIGLVLVTTIGCDQFSKRVAQTRLRGQAPMSYCGDTFRLEYAENPGAFLGLGGQWSHTARFALLIGFNGVLTLGIAGALLFSRGLSWQSLLACTLLLSGAIGNLIDRLLFDGHVIDFLNLGIGPLRTGIFNLADMAISLGAVLLILPSIFHGKRADELASEEQVMPAS